ncbi:MAG: hypothetical protein N2253_05595 [Bacteroidia bacterium]|nr:hypothetical protein [Bacteroidia bacterium]MCX7764346.1 hypothetical protein [Bacteroidia bacterium]MDW8057964.1 hypothetical protein [Bacteroidia bacterium]
MRYLRFLSEMNLRWYKGALIAGVLTALYLPFTLNQKDLLYKSSSLRASCEADEYCRANLLLFPLRLIIPHGDVWTYLGPVDYLFSQGRYWEDYRMPGYGVIYGFFRFLTGDREIAVWLLFFTQVVVWSVALGLISEELYKRNLPIPFILGLLILVSFSPAAYYVRVLGTESLTIAFGLMGIISLLHRAYFIAGILLTWAFFLRPLHILWIGLGILYLLLVERRIKPLWAFLAPFFVAEGAWVARNYIHYGDFRPTSGNGQLYYSYLYAKYERYVLDLLRYTGESDPRAVTRGHNLISILYCHDFHPPTTREVASMIPKSLRSAKCPPESLHVAATLACELAHSPSYTPAPPESSYYGVMDKTLKDFMIYFHPTPEDCEKELRIEKILKECVASAEQYYKKHPLEYIQNLIGHLLHISYAGSHYDRISSQRRLRVKVMYYEIYKWLYFLSIVLSLYMLLVGGAFERWIAASGLVILLAYMILGHLERRYLETVGPFFLINLALAFHRLLVMHTGFFKRALL